MFGSTRDLKKNGSYLNLQGVNMATLLKNIKTRLGFFIPTRASMKELIDMDTVKSKSALLTLMAIAMLVIFNIAYKRVLVTDPLPQITPITTNIIKELGSFAVKVRTGLFIKNLPEFDPIKNLFIFDAVIWFEFNADEIMREMVENFSFDKGNIMSKTTADIRIIDNKIFAKYNVLFNIKCDLNYHKFPFEDHRIVIVLANNFVTPEEMYFMVDGSSFQIAPKIFPASWTMQDLNIDAGYQKIQLDTQDKTKKTQIPKALFIINIIKSSARKILIIFLPLFAAIFFSFFSFAINLSNTVGRFTLAVSAVTALLGYRFVIEQMMPPVGYFTTTDEIYLFLLIMSLIIFIYQLLATRMYSVREEERKKAAAKLPPPPPEVKHEHKTTKQADSLEKLNNYTFIVAALLFIAITGYIILK